MGRIVGGAGHGLDAGQLAALDARAPRYRDPGGRHIVLVWHYAGTVQSGHQRGLGIGGAGDIGRGSIAADPLMLFLQGAPPVIDAQTVQTVATVLASTVMAISWLAGRLRKPGGILIQPPAHAPAPAPVATAEFLLAELVTARQLLVDERTARTISERTEREARTMAEVKAAERIKRLEDRVATLEDQLHTRDQLVAMLVEQLRATGSVVPAQALRVVQRTVENSGAGTPDGLVRSWLADHFSLADLGLLAGDALGIPPDAVAGDSPATYADSLIHYARRRDMMDLLQRHAKTARPNVPAPWDAKEGG